EDGGGSINAVHVTRPRGGLDRQVAFTATEVGDVGGRQQQPKSPRPRGPAPAGHELPRVISAPVLKKTLLAHAAHFLEPAVVRARVGRDSLELRAQPLPERRMR